MNAIKLLEQDHEVLKDLLKQGEGDEHSVAERKRFFEQLTRRLQAHEQMEEQILYPALAQHPKAHDIVLEGYEEHHLADFIVAELSGTDFADETWPAKWKVLRESLEHHIDEEEEDMFKKAKKIFDDDQLEAMGSEMEAIRKAS